MVQAIWQPKWVDTDFFCGMAAVQCKILSAEYVNNDKGKKELNIQVIGNSLQRKMSIYGDNCKVLIDAYGDDTDKWINKRITITQKQVNGKTHKVITIV
jgi:hypothetical protein